MVRFDALCLERRRDHDYAKVPFIVSRWLFHGMRCGHESNVLYAVSLVSSDAVATADGWLWSVSSEKRFTLVTA